MSLRWWWWRWWWWQQPWWWLCFLDDPYENYIQGIYRWQIGRCWQFVNVLVVLAICCHFCRDAPTSCVDSRLFLLHYWWKNTSSHLTHLQVRCCDHLARMLKMTRVCIFRQQRGDTAQIYSFRQICRNINLPAIFAQLLKLEFSVFLGSVFVAFRWYSVRWPCLVWKELPW